MKPRLCYRHTDGKWWCWKTIPFRVMGCGDTPQDAWNDMWELYGGAVKKLTDVETKSSLPVRYA